MKGLIGVPPVYLGTYTVDERNSSFQPPWIAQRTIAIGSQLAYDSTQMRCRHLTWIIPLLCVLIALLGPRQSRNEGVEIAHPTDLGISHGARIVPSKKKDNVPFAPEIQGIYSGRPLTITLGEDSVRTLLLQPNHLLTKDFGIRIGLAKEPILSNAHCFSGWMFPQEDKEPLPATLVIVGDHASGSWLGLDGKETTFNWTLGTDIVTVLEKYSRPFEGRMETTSTGRQACVLTAIHEMPRLASRPETFTGRIELTAAAQGGLEPATRQVSRYVDPISASESYIRSLKETVILIALDKSATGENDPDHLKRVASQWLATIANAATVYENQLGIRLRVQEIILTPEDTEFEDIPFKKLLPDFVGWLASQRPRNVYRWDSAFKVGRGLKTDELGSAYVGSLGSSDSVGAVEVGTGWDTLAHELGHALGSDHTHGGLMNQSANGGGNRDFFTDVMNLTGITAAREIYDHSAKRLSGGAILRHPEQIPFAQNDFRVVLIDESIHFNPTTNDRRAVRYGLINEALNVDSVSIIQPSEAGLLQHDGQFLTFTPNLDFKGPVWFSYTLRGSVGNEGRGWLHKGDVTLQVGAESPAQSLKLSPGESRTLFVGTASGTVTQPRDTFVHALANDEGRMLLRVHPDAEGTDAFTIGSSRFTITYQDTALTTRPDIYWHHAYLGTLRMYPLANDQPSSISGIQGLPELSVGAGPEDTDIEPFPSALHIVHAESFSPDKGTFELVSSQSMDELRFTPNADASGKVNLRYTAKDPNGSLVTENVTIHLLGDLDVLVPQNVSARYFIPRSSADEKIWMSRAFNQRSWPTGAMPLGYEDGRGYEDWIQTDVGRQMMNVNSSIYIRIPFEIADPMRISRLLLRMRADDGFVAYLNGKEVLRDNVSPGLKWHSSAAESREADDFSIFDLTEAHSTLRTGENLLAIQGMNAQIDSSDFLIMPELIGLTIPLMARITSPTSDSVSVSPSTGILFESEVLTDPSIPTVGAVTTHWQITEADALGIPMTKAIEGGGFEVVFADQGTYRIRLTARDESGAESTEERVIRVDTAKAYDQIGDTIRAGQDQSLDDYTTTLTANTTSASPGPDPAMMWQVVSGPGLVTFTDPSAYLTEATFSQSGQYLLRALTTKESLTLFDEVLLNILTEQLTLVGESSVSSYRYFTDLDYEPDWNHPDFSDAQWMLGNQGIGYDLTTIFDLHIDTDVESTMQHLHSSLYARYPFTLENVRTLHGLELALRADDGCAIYLNGHEVYRQHAPLYDLGPSATAVFTVNESQLHLPTLIDLTEFRSHLRPGYNVLAIHGLNQSITSSDFLIQPKLTAHMGQSDCLPDGLSSLSQTAPRIEPRKNDMLVSYLRTPDLETSGGRIDVETSEDLRAWKRWPHASRTITIVEDDGVEHVTLTGPRSTEMQFVRLRVSF